MMLGILTLLTALSISAVAIYYSVAGLVAIFAAAAIPIMIMGGVLEIGKLVTAVWLHRYWSQAKWWLKGYLVTAVLVLMFITSMGIFGFLSKAHIEQTSASTENVAMVETIQREIDRSTSIITRAENKIRELDSTQVNTDSGIQEQIDREQERIDTAYDRVQPLVEEQNKSLEAQIQVLGLESIDLKIATLDEALNIDTRDRESVRRLQSLVGARPDGSYGSGTAARVDEYRSNLNAERLSVLQQITDARAATNQEIARIRQGAEDQIAESNKLINRLREQLGANDNAQEIQTAIDEQNERIRTASNEIDQLTEEKIELESEYRLLEAEVGPIKYIAEFVYGEKADSNMLEEAVRWVIIIIIFVFDPLAVLLLIASQYTFEFARRKDDNGGWLRQYEQARAQRIVDNPGYNPEPPAPPKEEKEEVDVTEPTTTTDDDSRELVSEDDTTLADAVDTELEQSEVQTDEDFQGKIDVGLDTQVSTADSAGAGDSGRDTAKGMAVAGEEIESKKKSQKKEQLGSSEESKDERERRLAYEEKEKDEHFENAKQEWKHNNPDRTLKYYKNLYIKGVIDQLPWEDTDQDDNYKEEGYHQNSEQNENTLFNKLNNK